MKALYLVSILSLAFSLNTVEAKGGKEHKMDKEMDMKAMQTCIDGAKKDEKCAKSFKDAKMEDCADFFGGNEMAKDKCMTAWKAHSESHEAHDKKDHDKGDKH